MPSFTTQIQSLCSRIARSSKQTSKKGLSSSSQSTRTYEKTHADLQPKYLGDYSDFVSCADSSSLGSPIIGSPDSSMNSVLLPPGIVMTIPEIPSTASYEILSNMFSDEPTLESSPSDSSSLASPNIIESSYAHSPAMRQYVNELPHSPSEALNIVALESKNFVKVPSNVLSVAANTPVHTIKAQKPVETSPNFIEVDFAYPLSSANAVFPMPMPMHVPKKASAVTRTAYSRLLQRRPYPSHYNPSVGASTNTVVTAPIPAPKKTSVYVKRSRREDSSVLFDLAAASSPSEWLNNAIAHSTRACACDRSDMLFAPSPSEWLKNSRQA